ncbi:primosomal protein N' [Actinosynnema mirum]|uniref:Probable replication restart protein PriA n=1 Tax=Actinosynnema mirum (strain ATCC 29888 / DSM 43827 / JCM 3225 / NBRC 14064 / NCIMB 13271 / NRRL B-12336 / IMRU 3971 / 101) TaxID=446462 RepID=C6W8Y3_ACTMD|nr:primosomal protein N' [Actinosynnema mirum]ACU39055.1 Primosomal protein N' (replication factor Y) - superfamily II helicase-like protein [Actinosynnema mirum DSM 43827]
MAQGRAASRRGERVPAAAMPVARVVVDVPLPHLDRPFDYQVPTDLDEVAVPGVRVRVRFAGQLVDGYLLERAESTEYGRGLAFLEKVVSPEPVLAPEVVELARAVADRYAGTLIDVLRMAVPPRHARAEAAEPPPPSPPPERPADTGWGRYRHGANFLDALAAGRAPRAVWQALPAEDWPARLAEVAATVASTGKGVLVVVPDHRDLARLHEACARLVDPAAVTVLAAELGPQERYKRWLAVRRGSVRIALGARGAALAPVNDLGLVVVWDDGDDLHAEPRMPYPNVRDVLVQRSHLGGAAFLVGGFARTAEAQLLVDSGWAHEVVADRDELRAAAPRVVAVGDGDWQEAKDPAARSARLPSIAFEAARAALSAGAPVLIQVPRRGYVPALACGQCRAAARCRRCAGPLALPGGGGDGAPRPAYCRWCGATEAAFRCPSCGSRRLRGQVIGARRTAEELGRAFSGVVVRTSGGDDVLAKVPGGPALVVATPGAEPVADGGYGAALLLDGWALLGRADLRAAEEAVRRWMGAAALVRRGDRGGRIVVVAESSLAPVQALVRWDPVWHAGQELAARAELGFPPAVRMATLDASPDALAVLLEELRLPERGEVLGPVPLGEERERALVRVPRGDGRALSASLSDVLSVRSARKETEPVRVKVDPLEVL